MRAFRIYLHYVLDRWVIQWWKQCACGDVIMVCYAEDFVLGFQHLLGFTHTCGTHHQAGRFAVQRRTMGKRMGAKLKAIRAELRRRMHRPVAEMGAWLKSVVRGYFNYHAVPGNFSRLSSFRYEVVRRWWQAQRRRSQRRPRWEVFARLVAQYLPPPAILRPYPLERFCTKHPR